MRLHAAGELQAALREFDRVVELVPQSPFGWYNRGLVRRDLKDCRGALGDFTRALELDAKYFNALYQRGNCLQSVGEYERATGDYTRAIALPGQIHGRFLAYFARGDAWRRLGRLDEAYADYTSVTELRADTTALRSRAWVSFYRGRWREAHEDADRYLRESGVKEPAAAYAVILGALARQRDGRDAKQFLEQYEDRFSGAAWPAPVMRYLKGELTEAALLKAAGDGAQRTEALAYVGAHLLSGRKDAGIERLRKVVREGDPRYLEYDLAYHELRRLGLAQPSDRRERSPQ